MIVTFIGTERCDIPYYAACVAQMAEKKVAFIDNSNKGDMASAFGIFDQTQSQYYKKMIASRLIHPTEEYLSNFDIVINYVGQNTNAPLIDESDFVYAMTTYFPLDIEKNKRIFSGHKITDLICLDKLSSKVSENSIVKELEIPLDAFVHIIDFNAEDYERYFNLMLNGNQDARKTSVGIGNLLKHMQKNGFGEEIKRTMFGKVKENKPKKEEEDEW